MNVWPEELHGASIEEVIDRAFANPVHAPDFGSAEFFYLNEFQDRERVEAEDLRSAFDGMDRVLHCQSFQRFSSEL